MMQNCNIYRVLKVFLDDPLKGFRLREISRVLKLGLPSVSKYVKNLEKEELVVKKNVHGANVWFGNRESRLFKVYKRFETSRLIEESGLIDYLNKGLGFPTVVLYGSHALGEDANGSDIDLFVVASGKSKLDIERFEEKLKKKLHLFVHSERELEKLKANNKELINNILNGVVLSGYLKVL